MHFYQRKGAKRKRKLPDIIAKKDLKILNSVKRKAYRLDLQLSLCGVRLGWAGIIGLFPWIGDLLCLMLALQVVSKAGKIEGGLPTQLRLQMMANVTFDFVIGLIPIVGDFINIMYKCNLRNFVLLEKHLVDKYSAQEHSASVTETAPVARNGHLPSNTNRPVPEIPKDQMQTGIYNHQDIV